MTLLKLAMARLFLLGHRRRRDGEKGAEDFLIQREPAAQLGNAAGLALENNVHVETRAEALVGHAREMLPVHFLRRLDLAAHRGDLGADFVDRILDPFFLRRVIQDKQTFVSFHSIAFIFPLYWFMA